jgi:hypothetical protein
LFILAVEFLMLLSTIDSSYEVGTNLARSLRISDPKNYLTVYTDHVTGKGYGQFHGISGNKDTQIPGIICSVSLYAQAVLLAPTLHGGIMHLEEKHGVIDL